MSDKEKYLWCGGWLQNNRGWWHPPSCVTSWPIDEAYAMARRDEDRGLRMGEQELREYHREVGLSTGSEWIEVYREAMGK